MREEKDMALIQCPECGKEISDKAGKCPHCGYPIEKESSTTENKITQNETKTVNIDVERKNSASKKKVIVLSMAVILCCLIVGGILLKKDPMAKKMIEGIERIGNVTLESEEKIAELEEAYSELTEKQKNQVNNYVELKNARKELNELKEKYEEEKISETPYLEAIEISKILKSDLVNPESFLLNSVQYMFISNDMYLIDYTGENKMGGSTRRSIIIEVGNGKITNILQKGVEFFERRKELFKMGEDEGILETLDVELIMKYIDE